MDQLTHPRSLRSCILFQFFRGKPVFETYKNFCEVMGYEAIKFKEFEVWYHRFSRGEFDLDYDIGSNTSDLEFSNLPNDAIEKIMEKCDLKEQLTLRKVSKTLRSLVDEQKLAYKSIEINPKDSYIYCVYNDKDVVYASENWDGKNFFFGQENYCILRSDDYENIALNDMSIALNNPKLRLDHLAVYYDPDESPDRKNELRLESLLEHLNHQIHVKALTFRAESPKYLLSILPSLKPKVLVNIEVNGVHDRDDSPLKKISKRIRRIASLEQWKQAEELNILYCYRYFPSEFLMHFKHFMIVKRRVDKDFLMNLRDLFSTSTNFETCTIVSCWLRDCSDYFESFCEKVESEGEVIYRFKIPDDSNKMLEFKLGPNPDALVIEKKNI